MSKTVKVTRTVVTTKVSVMMVDTVNCEVFNETVTVPGTYTDDEKLLYVVKPMVETDTHKAVSIAYKEEDSKLYGMPLETFIQNATVLPLREKKENEENNENE